MGAVFIRKSNVTLALERDGEKILKRSDFVRGTSSYMVNIRCTKTLQNNSKILEHPLLLNEGNILFLVSTLDRMSHMIQDPSHCPAFCSPDGKAVSYWMYNNFSKDIIDRAGLNGDKYSSNSFRRGGCTLAALSGIIDRKLKKIGDWKLGCFQEYIHSDLQDKLDVAEAMSLAVVMD